MIGELSALRQASQGFIHDLIERFSLAVQHGDGAVYDFVCLHLIHAPTLSKVRQHFTPLEAGLGSGSLRSKIYGHWLAEKSGRMGSIVEFHQSSARAL